MKNILIAIILILFCSHTYASICTEFTKINDELNDDFYGQSQISVINEFLHINPTKEFSEFDILTDLYAEAACKNAMIKILFTYKNAPGQIFEAIVSNEDECDGGNAYGLIKNITTNTVIATISDQYISCL